MSGLTPLLVVGDSLLDTDLSGRAERLAPDAPAPVVEDARRTTRPGGAALAAYLAASDGREVTLITGLGPDEASSALRRLLRGRVRLVELPLTGRLPRKTRIMAGGRVLLRMDDGAGGAAGATEEAVAALARARAVLVSDYGRGAADTLRAHLAAACRRVPVVWDPHPRGGAPVAGVRLATPAAHEARAFASPMAAESLRREAEQKDPRAGRRPSGDGGRADAAEESAGRQLGGAARDARRLVRGWGVTSVAVTLGPQGALFSHGEAPLLVPTPWRAEGDACGAGDRFASAVAGLLADEVLPETAVQRAVHAAARYVADGGAHAVEPEPDPPSAVPGGPGATDVATTVARVRAAGGTVVAAGGCFDLLHAGHVALLQAARRAGDCLVVCVNSDASVRRRKGSGRPLVPVADRVRVLLALECVDAVAVFEEDTPESLLRELRPHVWAKGGDYALSQLPETALLESWGGQVVLLPYLDGRSTTRLADRAAGRPTAPPADGDPGQWPVSLRR
ncbi:D-glycero-beta-D-manno-heptose 1-phosphate adenylyltransferase [Streptomyces sp. TP-A0874]|uniref:D-glycero-beta-D-manno-heptose 1-phosphate adenylyltransferase n=1 Tax=Streptomyces sp. TP-A0874 TaxID=549819 RepID=UPI000853613D|nr:D-glycero-beta-D-manno-heptose 1-phosphate adenylyltransferase [Streptomyces sp. TP-A0874]